MKKRKAVICIPTYNEKDGVKQLIPEIFKITKDIKNWDVHILVADDTSPDGTYKEVKKMMKSYPNLHLLLNTEKVGLGGAYLKAFAHAIKEHKPEVIFEMDGDGQHTPTIIPNFLKKIEEGADFVVGSRYIKGGSIPSHWALWRKFISVVGSIFAQLTFMNFKVHDWTSGYRCIKASYLQEVLDEMQGFNGYVFQVALLDKAFKRHLTIDETPLHFTDRLGGESKMQSFQFMFDTLWYIFWNSSFVKYAIVGFTTAGIDFLVSGLAIGMWYFSKPAGAAAGATIAVIVNFMLNNFWSFNHKKISGKRAYATKFASFGLVSVGSVLIQYGAMFAALSIFGTFAFNLLGLTIVDWVVYKTFIIGFLVIPYSYFMYNTFIWKAPSSS